MSDKKEEFLELLNQADAFKRKLATMYNICYIRHTINTQDEFYSAENDYYDQNMPAAEQFSTRLSQAVMDSRFQELTLKELGPKGVFSRNRGRYGRGKPAPERIPETYRFGSHTV